MVNIFSTTQSEQIENAIATAEQGTRVEIATVVIPRSDFYISELMIYGFIIGSFINFLLWEGRIATSFPEFFFIQLICILMLPYTPGIKKIFCFFLPKKLLVHRASHLGAEEILAINQHVPPQTPVVLLFVSLAERYVHIFPNNVVNDSIEKHHWDKIINQFTVTLKTQELTQACTQAIHDISELLKPIFPDDDGSNFYKNKVMHSVKKK